MTRWAIDRDVELTFRAAIPNNGPGKSEDWSFDLLVLSSLLIRGVVDLIEIFRCHQLGARVLVVDEGESDSELRVAEALAAGADDAVSLHASKELEARLDRCLRRSSGVFELPLRLGDLWLDRAARKAFHVSDAENFRLIDLRNAEFAVLQYLVLNRERPVSLHELKARALQTIAGDHTVRNHIYELRKKLEDAGLSQLIRTLPGVGYQVSDPMVLGSA